MVKFEDWWYKNENKINTEKLFGKRASAICDRVDPKLELSNLYTDILEKFAMKYNLHLI